MPGGWRKWKELSLRCSVQPRFRKTSEPPICSYGPEKSKAGCGGSCSESVPTATGVLMEGCKVASAPAKVFS